MIKKYFDHPLRDLNSFHVEERADCIIEFDSAEELDEIFSNEAPTIVYRENTNWSFILQDLANRNIHSILVEGGTTLLQHILDSGIYDEVHIEVSNIPLPRTADQEPKGVTAPAYTPTTQPKVVNNHQIYIENLHK